MPDIEVQQPALSSEVVADVLRRGLGEGVVVSVEGADEVMVRQGMLRRAKVTVRRSGTSSVLEVRGQAPPVPVMMLTWRVVNERGIARRVAEVLRADEGLGARS